MDHEGGSSGAEARPPVAHIPVLLNEVLSALGQVQCQISLALDGTFGRGGHARAILDRLPASATLLACDQDQAAIDHARLEFTDHINSGRLVLYHENFGQLLDRLDAVSARGPATQASEGDSKGSFQFGLLDLGVSSPQLDQPERGFSFYGLGPLDMRMDQRQRLTAETIVNEWAEDDLLSVFRDCGEVERPWKVIRAIMANRSQRRIATTQDLASLIESADGWQKKGVHPATLYFMGLRIAVNREIEVLESVLPGLLKRLSMGGVLAVVSFHSLEDRVVKNTFKEWSDRGALLPRRPIVAGDEELRRNPRARSAKLRVFRRETPAPRNKYWMHSKN
jgi:16S rRNA (cytosine1402-N4)-methyltransferase